MKISFRLSFLAVAILLSACSYSQTSYRAGFVVISTGDTARGWIDYRQWKINPGAIRFKSDANADKVTTYTISDLVQFEMPEVDKYVRAIVNKDMHPVGVNQLEDITDTTLIDTVFLRVLVEGKVSLYQLEESKSHFYIKEPGKDYDELIYKEYMRNQCCFDVE